MNTVDVLRSGYSYASSSGKFHSSCTMSLVFGRTSKILVDTGLPIDKEALLSSLKERGLTPDDIDIVVATHGHSDHVGNLSLFPSSLLIVSCDISRGDEFIDNQLKMGVPYSLDEGVEVVYAPGHTDSDVCVIVCDTDRGTVAISGDIFERESDIDDASLWQSCSSDVTRQASSRCMISQLSDLIIPGHGPSFSLTSSQKEKLLLQHKQLTRVNESS